tara:strand:+ start:1663 stop:3570 length:1908 start_codon:yes stop_codon:yes gene_type:complete
MKKSELRNIIKESVKNLITEQPNCNPYQNRIPGPLGLAVAGAADACASTVTAIRCTDIPSNFVFDPLLPLTQVCDVPGVGYGTGGCYNNGSRVKIQGSNFPFTNSGNCVNGHTPVPGDHMLSHNTAGSPAYVAWLVVDVGGFSPYCGGPRREWHNCNPGWTSAGCMEPGMPLYSSTHTEDCAGNPIPNAAGQFGDTSCCGTLGCTDPLASNYDPNATVDDGSCVYDVFGCLGTSGPSGTCDIPPMNASWYAGLPYTFGMLNHDCAAGNTNYPCSDGVTQNDGSCIAVTMGCHDPAAVNFYGGACISQPSSCLYWGCNDQAATNYNSQAAICDPAVHPYPPGTGCCEYDGCNDPIASNYNPVATGCGNPPNPNDTSCCIYTATRKCDEDAWKAHVWQNYSQLNGDPNWQVHFCEYCQTGVINPLQEPWCKCCDPVIPEDPCEDYNNATPAMQQGCCDKCQTMGGTLPPGTQCHDLTNNCDCCPRDTDDPIKGCLDPNALNPNKCCPQVDFPGCVPTVQYDECCEYETGGGDGPERGCITPQDPTMTVLNVGTCCPQNNYPGCVPTIHQDSCCDYQEPTGGPATGSLGDFGLGEAEKNLTITTPLGSKVPDSKKYRKKDISESLKRILKIRAGIIKK